MNPRWIATALVTAALVLPATGQAFVIVSFDLPGGGGTFQGDALELPAGDTSFDVKVFLETDQSDVTGFNIEIAAMDASTSLVAALLSFSFASSGVASGVPGSVLTLNYGDFPNLFPSGALLIGTLSIDTTILGPLGTLSLSAVPSNYVNDQGFFGEDIAFDNSGEALAVVTPEPATLSLTVLALAGLAMFTRRLA